MTDTVFCGACGTQLAAEARFCASCGTSQDAFEAGVQLPQAGADAPPAAVDRDQVAAQGRARPGVAADPVAAVTQDPVGAPALGTVAAATPAESGAGDRRPVIGVVVLAIGVVVLASVPVMLLFGTAPGPLGLILLLGLLAAIYGAWRATTEGGAREVDISAGSTAKVRSFWAGFTLSLLTLGVYGLFWYYLVNDELKDVGAAKGDENLAHSNPMMSVAALLVGGWLILPPFLSVYNYGQRIRRAQRLGGVPVREQINPTTAFLLYFPGLLLVVPYFVHFWYVTRHQNAALRANAQPPVATVPAPAGAVG